MEQMTENARQETLENSGFSTAERLARIESLIALHMEGVCQNLLDVGRCLIEARERELVPHGAWGAWVQRNTGMSERNAQRLMSAARAALPGTALARLPVSKINAILALPEGERDDMAREAEDKQLSVRQLNAAIAERDQAREALRVAQNNMEQRTQERVRLATAGAEARISARQAEIDTLRRALKAAEDDADVSEATSAEIDRLRAELKRAEAYAERQAQLRSEAQRELLNRKLAAGRGA